MRAIKIIVAALLFAALGASPQVRSDSDPREHILTAEIDSSAKREHIL